LHPADSLFVDVSVVIPTRNRTERLAACLHALSEQDFPRERYETLVGVDGMDGGESAVFSALNLRGGVFPGDQRGPATTRNRVIRRARGRILLLLNDDVVPHPSLLGIHYEEHLRCNQPAMILGDAPWAITQPDRLFDRLIRETSMVFFYDQMTGDASRDRDRDWGFRHAWTLNLSAPAECAKSVGGFCEAMSRPVYEDLEFAWRLAQRVGIPVLYRPSAVVTHHHRYEPLEFLKRDIVLGHQAWRLAEVSPQCAMEMFGVEVRSDRETAYTREFLVRQANAARRTMPMFLRLAAMPASSVDGPYSADFIQLIYEQTLFVRRYLWRWGHHAASEGKSIEEAMDCPLVADERSPLRRSFAVA
jgi:GT2 family glycosyltransferase